MRYSMVTIDVLLEVEGEGEAADAISETMRPLLREFAGAESCIIDWRYNPGASPVPEPHNGSGFEYAEPDTSDIPEATEEMFRNAVTRKLNQKGVLK